MRSFAPALILLVGSLSARAEVAPKPLCALVKACALEVAVPGCGEAESKPLADVLYDAARCSEPRDLLAHGVTPAVGIGGSVHAFLGGRYRVVYDMTGEAPISEARFDYLAKNLPFAARLATRFTKTRYSMDYLGPDRKRFHCARADKLVGDAEMLFASPAEKRRTYYGWGTSKLGPWKLHGSAFVDIRLRVGVKNPKGISYDVRVRTAPVNAFVNAIMRMGMFKGYVIGQIQDTMKDLVGAATVLSSTDLNKLLSDPTLSIEDRDRIREFALLP